jgi:ATP-dependent DNA helicase RecG
VHNPLKQLKLRRPIVAKAVDCRVVVNRFIEHPPQSRNEDMGAMLRRVVVCARRGSGWDKVTFVVEANQLLTPLIQATKNHTRGALFGHKELSVMTRKFKLRPFQHSQVVYVMCKNMINTNVRARFGIPAHKSLRPSVRPLAVQTT